MPQPAYRIPNLFIAGAPKCGTFSMYEYLRQHPQVFFPDRKEPNFFNRDMPEVSKISEAEYLDLYAAAPAEARWLGDATPLYMMSEVAARNIAAMSPDARIVIMLRRPADLLLSVFQHNQASGVETLPTFEEALAAEADRRAGRNLPKGVTHTHRFLYRDFAQFSSQIERFLAQFGRDRVHFILYDDFRKDTPGEFARSLDFLGLEKGHPIRFEIHNAARKSRSPFLKKLLKYPPPAVSAAARLLLPASLRRRIFQSASNALTTKADKTLMLQTTENQLVEEFRGEVERLEKLIGRDLSGWQKTRNHAHVAV